MKFLVNKTTPYTSPDLWIDKSRDVIPDNRFSKTFLMHLVNRPFSWFITRNKFTQQGHKMHIQLTDTVIYKMIRLVALICFV